MSERRTRRWTIRLLLLFGVLLVAEAALVVAVLLSPNATRGVQSAVAAGERWWNGTDDSAGMATRLSQEARHATDGWVRLVGGRDARPKDNGGFGGCIECHDDYASKRRFVTTYMDHPRHAELGVQCDTCHREVEHPNPPAPPEEVCADCHQEVRDPKQCVTCHPPGSIPHFYRLGYPRGDIPECTTCHPPGSFESRGRNLVRRSVLDGSDRSFCESCHLPTTCQECHGINGGGSNPHPSNWIGAHGIGPASEGPSKCQRCHTSTWCADRCHSDPDKTAALADQVARDRATPGGTPSGSPPAVSDETEELQEGTGE